MGFPPAAKRKKTFCDAERRRYVFTKPDGVAFCDTESVRRCVSRYSLDISYDPCMSDYVADYLNRADVQATSNILRLVHAPYSPLPYEPCGRAGEHMLRSASYHHTHTHTLRPLPMAAGDARQHQQTLLLLHRRLPGSSIDRTLHQDRDGGASGRRARGADHHLPGAWMVEPACCLRVVARLAPPPSSAAGRDPRGRTCDAERIVPQTA